MSALSLPQLPVRESPAAPQAPAHAKRLLLSQLAPGETGRIVRVAIPDSGCRKRFAELGLAVGMKVSVLTAGETLMLQIGTARMALAARCADEITVLRV